MKTIMISLLIMGVVTPTFSQNPSVYRIFGEILTVENKTYKGYITWAGNQNYWIDFFEASKINNPYKRYFHAGDGVIFSFDGQTSAYPPTHHFSCRFGNLSRIRLTGPNEITLTLKNGQECKVVKNRSRDIGYSLQIATDKEIIHIPWEQISEITFQAADQEDCFPLHPVYGILKSTQGIYKGLITWNTGKNDWNKNETICLLLNKMKKIVRDKAILKVIPQADIAENFQLLNTDILYPIGQILVNMPNTGSVSVPWERFETLEIIRPEELSGLGYADFPAPRPIQGKVTARTGEIVQGTLVYDLDETLDIETLDGKNDNIIYRIPFKYIRSVEPKNYKYSFIALRDGNSLSLGETCDVDQENSGMMVLGKDLPAVYIPWNEVKSVEIE